MTDDDGASTKLVEEVLPDLPSAPTVHSGGASGTTVHGAIFPENQSTDWFVEYGPTSEYGAVTSSQSLSGDSSLHQVSTHLPGAEAGRVYHYRVVASNASGSTSVDDRVMVAGSTPGSDAYRDAILGTSGVASYWRLGELSGSTASDEASATTGTSRAATSSASPACSARYGTPPRASTASAAR